MIMPQKPKIMVLAPDLPYPITSGGRRRMASMIQGMADFAAVHLACCVASESEAPRGRLPRGNRPLAERVFAEPAGALAKEAEVACAEWIKQQGGTLAYHRRRSPGPLKIWLQRAAMIIRRCSLVYYPDEKRFIDRQFSEFQPDVVWLESPYLLRYAMAWLAQLPVIVDYWGTSQGAHRDYSNARGLRKVWQWFRWQTGKGGEQRYAPRIRDIVTVSRPDGEFFRAMNKRGRVWSIPIGIEDLGNLSSVPEDAAALIMTGDLSYRPNVDAAQYFVREIFPLIRAQHPRAQVRFAGRNPSPAVQALQAVAGVRVQGFIPDLSQAIAESAVYILPMRLGSGIRTKLFDVFPLGKPIVSTTVGVEGLELKHQQDCVIADTAPDFARACCALLADEAERRRLGANARKMALQLYAPDNIAQLIKETVTTAIASFDTKVTGK